MKLKYIGADLTQYAVNGDVCQRIYLDSAASSLPIEEVQQAMQAYLPFYGSFHSEGHLSASLSMDAFFWAGEQILNYLGADPDIYEVVFIGTGATAAINRIAEGMAAIRGNRDIVVISAMEHHSNDLPHRQHSPQVLHVQTNAKSNWIIDLDELSTILETHGDRIHYIAVTAASNVTGLLNPIAQITRLAHQFGVKVLVDGAQVYAHSPFSMKLDDTDGIDFFVFSGHKAHAPGSPGVIVAKKDLLSKMPPQLYGGGMVDEVSKFDFSISTHNLKKEHAGTQNVTGAISLGLATKFIETEGLVTLAQHEQNLKQHFINGATKNKLLRLYACQPESSLSLGIVSFNLEGIPFHLLGNILNDYFCIAVRTGCFCAHPYVRELLFEDFVALSDSADPRDHTGMVRFSLGPHNTIEDMDRLLIALQEIGSNLNTFRQSYVRSSEGLFHHKNAKNNNVNFIQLIQKQTPQLSW